MKNVVRILMVVVCAAVLWAQELVICKSCGREAKEGETKCSRCDTALPEPHKEVVPVAPPTPAAVTAAAVSAEVAKMTVTAIEGNYRLAKDAEEAQQTPLALCYYQNAMALMRLVSPGQLPKDVGDALLNGRGRAFKSVMTGMPKCKICGGSGKYQMDQRKVDPNAPVKVLTGVPCTACKGKGGTVGMADVAQAKNALQQGRAEFERRQMLAGEVRLGKAFVPAAMEKLLKPAQRALVMAGMQLPCDSCQGTTRQTCTSCRGTRWVKCTYTGCRNGELQPVQPKKGEITSKRINEDTTTKCPRCKGLAEVPCAVCEGNGSTPCQQCSGSGTAPRCLRCTGTGLQECSKCKGAGNVKGAPCADCGGDGIGLCTTCKGEGAKAK